MNATKRVRTANVLEKADTTTAPPLVMGVDEQRRGGLKELASDTDMSDAMRTVVWVTGVAFGVVAPGAFAQGASAAKTTPTRTVLQKLDTNHEGLISREPAQQDHAVNAVLSQVDTNGSDRLDEDAIIKAIPIRQS